MSTHDPSKYQFSTPVYVLLFGTLLTAYYMCVFLVHSNLLTVSNSVQTNSWDTSMSQKSRFKMQTQGVFEYRKTFPQLPNGTIENPKFIQTAHGNRLLVDGWWAWSRKPVRLP